MDANEYQVLAMRTRRADQTPEQTLLNAVLGLNGEAGEVADILKKHLHHSQPLDTDKLCDELGDVLWYVAQASDALGICLADIMQMNLDKLQRRYPQGFSPEASLHRQE
ncbi:MAG: nucleoside triphosphate pyrophosphohydrolase family protein [Herpetosiphonaceae bacterium]|nr:nucleoside triphosphate pyrophosphohydrolase family protein [Herpetosiphonaceae bacterium]